VAAAAAAMWLPLLAGFILGIAFGGFAVQLRLGKRLGRLRREVDDLLRENGSLRHRNTVLSSGIITREAQMTQALVSIPEDDERPVVDPQRTQMLPTLPDDEDDLPEEGDLPEDEHVSAADRGDGKGDGKVDGRGDGTGAAASDKAGTANKTGKRRDNGASRGEGEKDGGPAGDTADLGEAVGSRSNSRR